MALFKKLAVLAVGVTQAAAGIYPDDHWQYSTQLTTSNFNSEVTAAVDSGKTMFVRWIASEGCGCCVKQSPKWNEVVKQFANEDSVVFGDVNLAASRVTTGPNGGSLSPGAGGWPTVRYFNKATGYDGAPYTKKTGDPVCTELGPGTSYLADFITEVGVNAASASKEL